MKNWYVNLVMETSDSAETDDEYTCVINASDEESAESKARSNAWNKGLNSMKTYCATIGEVPQGFNLL